MPTWLIYRTIKPTVLDYYNTFFFLLTAVPKLMQGNIESIGQTCCLQKKRSDLKRKEHFTQTLALAVAPSSQNKYANVTQVKMI